MQEISLKNKGLGSDGEEIACDYLANRGFLILERNFICKGGEIDIVAEKDGAIHFVEVKTRSLKSLESSLEAITQKKQKRVRRAAEIWLSKARNSINDIDLYVCYLSVVGVDVVGGNPTVEFIEDAFI